MAPSLIAAIVLGMWLSTTSPSSPAPSTAAALGGLSILAIALAAIPRLLSLRVRSFARGPTADYSRIHRLFDRTSRFAGLAPILAFLGLLLGASWLDFVRQFTSAIGSSLLEQTAILAPYFLFQGLWWWGLLPIEGLIDGRTSSRRPADVLHELGGRARRQWGLLLPILAFVLLTQDGIGYLRPDWATDVMAQAVVMAALGFVVTIMAPHLLRLVWTTRPLPAGPLRDRLESIAARHGLRFREILLWDTDQRMVNAVVTGILPCSRYVLLSDALVHRLDPAEIEAIFGHEIGHVAHRHLSFLSFFAVATLVLIATNGDHVAQLWTWALPAGIVGEAIHGLVTLGLVGGFFFVAFGCLSRRFERQADLFGCRVASESLGPGACLEVATFARALHRTASYNGIDPNRPNWRHGSIRDRVIFLQNLAANPRAEQSFQARVRRVRFLITGLLVSGLAASGILWMLFPHD